MLQLANTACSGHRATKLNFQFWFKERISTMFKLGISIIALTLCPAAVLATPAMQMSYADFVLTEPTAERAQSKTYTDCLDESGGVTVSMRECIGAEFQRIDKRLNASYKTTMQRLSNQSRMRLRSEERAWLKTRLDTCERDLADAEGGTLWLIEMDACALTEHIRRTVWVENYR
jgi:uncharacterized protein YecT (DUF1311 family)